MQTQSKAFNAANITKGVKQISDATGKMFQQNFESSMQWVNDMQNVLGSIGLNLGAKKDDCGACPPECECPPHCLISIIRNATIGEIILVPFKVKNTLQTAKVYKVGVRPIYDDDGNVLPLQPVLNKTDLNLQPGQSILVEMRVAVGNGYTAGSSYSTEIVIREKDVNQNICFTLNVTANANIPEAHPRKEEDYFNHFQDWRSHYYCDRKPTLTRVATNLDVTPATANPAPANVAGTPK